MKSIVEFFSDYWARMKLFNRNIRLMMLSQIITSIGLISFHDLFFTLYLRNRGFSNEFIGNTQALIAIAMVVFALPAGYLAGRYNHKWTMIIAQVCASVLYAGAINSFNTTPFLSLIFLSFAAVTFIQIVSMPFIMGNSSALERTYIISISFTIMHFGNVLGNLVGGFGKGLIDSFNMEPMLSYRYILIAACLLAIIGVIPLLFIRKTAAPVGEEEKKIKLFEFAKWNWGFFVKAAIPSTLVAIGAGLIVQFISLYFRDVFHSSDTSIAFYRALQSVVMPVGILLAPVLAEKFGKVNTIVITELISIPFMIVLALTGNISLAVPAFILRAAFMNMSHPVSSTLVMELCEKEQQGMLNAILSITWGLSWAFSAWVFGQLDQETVFRLSFFLAAGLYLISAVLYYFFFRHAEKNMPGVASCIDTEKQVETAIQ